MSPRQQQPENEFERSEFSLPKVDAAVLTTFLLTKPSLYEQYRQILHENQELAFYLRRRAHDLAPHDIVEKTKLVRIAFETYHILAAQSSVNGLKRMYDTSLQGDKTNAPTSDHFELMPDAGTDDADEVR